MKVPEAVLGAKSCTKCGDTKPLEEFSRETRSKDGRRSHCKLCDNASTARWERQNQQRRIEKSKRWAARNRKYKAEKLKEWEQRNPHLVAKKLRRQAERHPEKIRARQLLKDAVKTGKVVKPGTCEACGHEVERRKLHGHHEDYEKPLDVRWLCRPCHDAEHSVLNHILGERG